MGRVNLWFVKVWQERTVPWSMALVGCSGHGDSVAVSCKAESGTNIKGCTWDSVLGS